MQVRFDRPTYRQRAQIETLMSMIKRRQGGHVGGRSFWSQCRDLRLLALTHNVLLLVLGWVFYRAAPALFLLFCSDRAGATLDVRPHTRSGHRELITADLRGVEAWVVTTPVDMRKSFDGLAEVIRRFLCRDPLSGSLFAFRNKGGHLVKILCWDRDGLAI
jgi:hypothetical protein